MSVSADHDYGQLLALPPHVKRLEESLRLEPFLSYVEKILSAPCDSISEDSSDDLDESQQPNKHRDSGRLLNSVTISKAERKADNIRLYNFTRIKRNRKWLKVLLCSEGSSDEGEDEVTEADMYEMLRMHQLEKRHRKKFQLHTDCRKYMYYSAGLLSNYDRHPDHFKQFESPKKKTSKEQRTLERKIKAQLKKLKKEQVAYDEDEEDEEDDEDDEDSVEIDPWVLDAILQRQKQQSKKTSKAKKLTPEQALAKRHKVFTSIAKKEIPRAHKQKVSAQKEILANLKKLSHQCMRERRRAAIQSQKMTKDSIQRAKRLTREMLAYWKRFEKVEREHRKKAVKEAQEQRKIDVELREARRQQRKLNFLITQTELYAHFMARKMTGETEADMNRILSQLDDESSSRRDKRKVGGGVLLDINDEDHYGQLVYHFE